MPNAVISAASSGANTIVAAVTGCKIRVHGYVFIAADTVNATWKSNTTALSGALPLVAQAGAVAPLAPRSFGVNEFWFETNQGEALILSLDAAKQISGHLSYSLSP